MLKVNRRGGFSDRNGIESLNTEIQLQELDERTRIKIINTIKSLYQYLYSDFAWTSPEKQRFHKYVIQDIYCNVIEINALYNENEIFKRLSETLLNDKYYNVLTVVEAIGQYFDAYWKEKTYDKYPSSVVYKCLNDVFEKEYVGYRFIGNIISPITDEIERDSINETINNKYRVVREHIQKANAFLADRNNPDYENSIKESISAVEAMCQLIMNTKGKDATLGNMLKKLEDDGLKIHPAMKQAFNILYGYTSDANGIRHAGNIGGAHSTFEEAKFMLVSCCAFINYLQGVRAN